MAVHCSRVSLADLVVNDTVGASCRVSVQLDEHIDGLEHHAPANEHVDERCARHHRRGRRLDSRCWAHRGTCNASRHCRTLPVCGAWCVRLVSCPYERGRCGGWLSSWCRVRRGRLTPTRALAPWSKCSSSALPRSWRRARIAARARSSLGSARALTVLVSVTFPKQCHCSVGHSLCWRVTRRCWLAFHFVRVSDIVCCHRSRVSSSSKSVVIVVAVNGRGDGVRFPACRLHHRRQLARAGVPPGVGDIQGQHGRVGGDAVGVN